MILSNTQSPKGGSNFVYIDGKADASFVPMIRRAWRKASAAEQPSADVGDLVAHKLVMGSTRDGMSFGADQMRERLPGVATGLLDAVLRRL